MSGVDSRSFVLVIEQLCEAIRQQAHNVLSRVNVQWFLAIRYRQPQLDVVSIRIRRLAEPGHCHQTFGAVAQSVDDKRSQIINKTFATQNHITVTVYRLWGPIFETS